MKTFSQSLKRQDGFTLVELMVVVAIIGLLSAVAIPNFKKYQAKAKISEAKLQLSAIYTAEAAFFSDFNMYAKCLRYMGYDPDLERSNRYYATGFFSNITARNGTAHATALSSGMSDAACPANGTAVDGTANNTATATFFYAGKGMGTSIVAAMPTGNLAITGGNCAVAGTNGGAAPTGGNCVGSQANAANMAFIAAAVGIISADAITMPLASGLTIDNNKVIRTQVTGF
jgi:type IV pilus assembly protein PilA